MYIEFIIFLQVCEMEERNELKQLAYQSIQEFLLFCFGWYFNKLLHTYWIIRKRENDTIEYENAEWLKKDYNINECV